MEVPVLNLKGEKVRTVELPANIFEVKPNVDLMHQAYVRQMANARQGTHDTKIRSEVAGGGGKIHTPHPRDYTLAMPRKMRRAALRSALSVKAAENGIVVLDQLNFSEPKTKLVADAMSALVGAETALVIIPKKDAAYDTVNRAMNNLPSAKSILASYLNIRDLFSYDKVVLPVEALDVIAQYLG